MKFTNENFGSMTADLDLINLLLDQFKKDLNNDKKGKLQVLKEEKKFIYYPDKTNKIWNKFNLLTKKC